MKKRSKDGVIRFIADKGFYIILFLCITAIGASAYVLFYSDAANQAQEMVFSADDFLPGEIEVADNFVFTMPEQEPREAPAVTQTAPEPPKEKPAESTAAEKKPEPVKMFFVKPLNGIVIEPFSGQELAYNRTLGDWRVHNGTDIKADLGAKVNAIADGTVTKVYQDPMLGTTVVIEHLGGYVSIYQNLMAEPGVTEGHKVLAGAVIGGVGDTAASEIRVEPHLHICLMKDGELVDPMTVINLD